MFIFESMWIRELMPNLDHIPMAGFSWIKFNLYGKIYVQHLALYFVKVFPCLITFQLECRFTPTPIPYFYLTRVNFLRETYRSYSLMYNSAIWGRWRTDFRPFFLVPRNTFKKESFLDQIIKLYCQKLQNA